MAELENRWLDLGEFIREQRRIGQLSLRKLSEMAGISNPYLSQIERGLRKPSAEILQQIARALEISSETLYVRAGILDDERDHDLITEIRRDPTLGEDQKKALISIYESFRTENAVKAAQLSVVLDEAFEDAVESALIEGEIEAVLDEAVEADLIAEIVVDDQIDDDPLLDEEPESAPDPTPLEGAEPDAPEDAAAAPESLAER